MRKFLPLIAILACASILFSSCKNETKNSSKEYVKEQTIVAKVGNEGVGEGEEYDGPAERNEFEFERVKDPRLAYVPVEKLWNATNYTINQKRNLRTLRTQSALNWAERGPIYDLVGPSGNSRGGPGTKYTAGRTRAILIDTLNDPTGNTVFTGGANGGLWKCTDFITGGSNPSWVPIDDRFDNMAISYICQDPVTPSTLYFSTGEPYNNADAVIGLGVWKSTNGGSTWTRLTTTAGFRKIFKIVCDASGNLYLANRVSVAPSNADGLYRSTDGGSSWQSITPAVRTSTNAICTDLEFTAGGRLHASFGYVSGSGALQVQHQYTDAPSTATSALGWMPSAGIRISGVTAHRLELATSGTVMYAVTTSVANNVDSCYKSTDGGGTWSLQNTVAYTASLTNTQGWYNLTLAINPANTDEFLVAGLDAYKSTNSGSTITRQTCWASCAPYVHADHHFMQWWLIGAQSRIVIGGDGGVFLSNDGGVTWDDRNRNLGIKQFYAGSIHPNAGSNYMLAGAQDNGVHQLNQPGKSFSTEVTGGDGAFVHINQQNPQIQFGSYVFNEFRRSTNGGATWSAVNFSSSAGRFINPWDYDDGQNNLYACWGAGQILRWTGANTGASASALTLTALAGTTPSAFKVSPFTRDRVYIGSGSGKAVRLDNASTVTAATINANVTDISGSITGYVSCVNSGTSDNVLVATVSSYGVAHVYYSINGGTSWTNISGDLPDMPVRWAVFDPQSDTKLFLATEAGVYYTDAVNGGSTSWTSDPNFPTVRTDMLKVRLSDNTIMASTHGRGVYTATIPATPEIRFNSPFITVAEATAGTVDCRGYTDYTVNISTVAAPTGDATVTYSIKAGNTALEGVDFDFTSNGNFSASSKQHTFSSGVTATRALTIRVYDDAAIEVDEAFTISFAVTGATDAYAGSYNNYIFTIRDNDFAPIPTAPGIGTVGTGNFGGYVQPLRGTNAKSKSQFLYLASELTAAGFSPGNITSLALRITSKASTITYTGFTVSLKPTTITVLGGDFETGVTQYFTGNYTSSVGVNTFTFSTPFNWDGTSNVLVEFCYDNAAGSGTGDDNVSMNTTSDVKGIWSRVNTGSVSGCSLSVATATIFAGVGTPATYIRPDITLNGIRTNNSIETVLNVSKTSYLSPNDDVLFYNSNGYIIARIKNLSGSNYACTQVTVDRAGSSAVPFWNNNPANYLTSKTLQVVPTTNNPSGQYHITMYFTAAEKAGWEAATGQNWNSIQVVKVKSQIKNYSPATLFPDGPGAVEAATPTFGTYGSDYTLTATFSSGFSGFAAGIIGFPLPISLTDFTGKLDNSTTVLNWSTSSEQNSKNFDIEKSTDGLNYYHIGSINAAGTSTSRRDYSLRDGKLSASNYYRLRMNDLDGKNKLSNVVLIKYDAKAQNVWVVNNPFNNFIDLRFAKDATQAKLQLISANGAMVAEKAITNASGIFHWQLTGNLSSGSYILRAVVDGKVFTSKLIKQ